MALVDTVVSLVPLLGKAPPPIAYAFGKPRYQWVPDVALKKIHSQKGFLLAGLSLTNLSSTVLKDVRIKLPFAPEYEPNVERSSRSVALAMAYDRSVSEFRLDKLDPDEELFIAIHLLPDEADRFTEPQVIIGDRLLSRGMRTAGFFKRSPGEALLMTAAIGSILAAAGMAGFLLYRTLHPDAGTLAIQAAVATLQHQGCEFKSFPATMVNDTLLAKHELDEALLLRINQVVTRKDLLAKEQVVLCVSQ